ncbi:glycoside hydrolase family 3 N-terminal domain-containing protein [Flavihumibacter solisilvae]|uniref:glycoside hydrolase family 3 N-terminal domain-containing protein n=1 Tax=Flavihumibacter solisilvae TaxID=1349421 RepID=UPI000689E846|nr:glycoside hydrolase family 3 N-terminal domain-containing protein [Flavihumibacter solisilvae]
MKQKVLLVLVLTINGLTLFSQTKYKYKNPALSAEVRTWDLVSHMTLEEKVGQLVCPLGWEMYDKQGDKVQASEKYKAELKSKYTGMFWAVYRADPWTKKTLATGLTPKLAAEAGNAMQRYAIENTRLGIPVFIAEEAPHGHMAIGTTSFPTGIGLSATWNPGLLTKIGGVISKEIRLQGAHISYGPVLDLSREPRWSRVEESFGEDPVLTAKMAVAMVKGNGGGDVSKPYSTISTLKHFIAYGIPEGGHNGNTAFIGERELHENFLYPFKEAVAAGTLSVMTAYNSIDGVPCTANGYLLNDVLRKDWGFKGFVVSDLYSIDGIRSSHRVAQSLEEAGTMALKAGVDVDLGANAFMKLIDAVKGGRLKVAELDTAVYRVLKLKFDMGLFEHPYVDPKLAASTVRSNEHIEVARQAARESVVLLENKNRILPLSKDVKKIAVIGPNADNIYNQLGDYTAPQEEANIVTVLEGITGKVGASKVEYVKGCAIRDTTEVEIAKAVMAASNADVAIVVVGGSSARDFKTSYLETGAAVASSKTVSDMESGEGFDRASLDLMGKQLDLLKAIKATGKPVIVVYIEGRPLDKTWAAEHADALLTAFYPGQEGGNGIADVLFGDYNPSGRLPISVPRNVGQIPVYYNRKNPRGHDYVEMPAKPLYAFGYGLSYTQFDYSGLSIVKKAADNFEVSFVLANTGAYDGEEVAQLYVRDEYASVVQPAMQLKQFEKVFLKKGDKKRVSFMLTANDLSVVNKEMKRVVEPGDFTVMIGGASDQLKLKEKIMVADQIRTSMSLIRQD